MLKNTKNYNLMIFLVFRYGCYRNGEVCIISYYDINFKKNINKAFIKGTTFLDI